MTPTVRYITTVVLPNGKKEALRVKRNLFSYSLIKGFLYLQGFIGPLLKCLTKEDGKEVLEEIHEGSVEQHLGGKMVAKKTLRRDYFFPTMSEDAMICVQKYSKFQKHGDIHVSLSEDLIWSLPITTTQFYCRLFHFPICCVPSIF